MAIFRDLSGLENLSSNGVFFMNPVSSATRRDFLTGVGSAVSAMALAGCQNLPGATDTAAIGTLQVVEQYVVPQLSSASGVLQSRSSRLLVSSKLQTSAGSGWNGLIEEHGDDVTQASVPGTSNTFLNGVQRLASGAVVLIATERSATDGQLVQSSLLFADSVQELDRAESVLVNSPLASGVLADEELGLLFVATSELSDYSDLYEGVSYKAAGQAFLEWRDLNRRDQIINRISLSGVNATGLSHLPDGRVLALTSGTEQSPQAALHIVDPVSSRVDQMLTLPENLVAQLSGHIAVSDDGRYAYVGTVDKNNQRRGEFLKVDLQTGRIQFTELNSEMSEVLGRDVVGAFHVATKLHDGKLYVADFNNKVVMALDAETLALIDVIDLEFRPGTLDVGSDGTIVVAGEDQVMELQFA